MSGQGGIDEAARPDRRRVRGAGARAARRASRRSGSRCSSSSRDGGKRHARAAARGPRAARRAARSDRRSARRRARSVPTRCGPRSAAAAFGRRAVGEGRTLSERVGGSRSPTATAISSCARRRGWEVAAADARPRDRRSTPTTPSGRPATIRIRAESRRAHRRRHHAAPVRRRDQHHARSAKCSRSISRERPVPLTLDELRRAGPLGGVDSCTAHGDCQLARTPRAAKHE